MKEIKTDNFQKRQADLIPHPPVAGEEESTEKKTRKKKKIYQLNRWVDDVDGDE